MNIPVPGIAKRFLDKLSGRHRAGLFGIGWSGFAQVIGLFIKLGSTLILTRLLAPEVYGILGTAMAVLTTLEWLSDLGIQPALIRHEKGGKPEYLRTGWTMGLGRGAILSFFAAISAWPLAMFYDEPTLVGVLLVLAIRPLIMAMRSPAFPMLRRKLNYKYLFVDEICMTGVGTVCSIAMAFMFQSVWAIVLGTMAGALTSMVMSYVLCPMKPRLQWDREAAKDVYGLGRQVFVNTLVMAAWLNLDRLMGLRLLTPEEMGIYAIAFNLSAVIEGLVTRICDVYFSVLAREEGEEAQSRWHNMVCEKASVWLMPLAAIGLLVSPWVIWILYDPRYEAAGVIFAIMIARLMIRGFGQLQFQYLLALARVHIATLAYVVAAIVQVVLLFPMAARWGVTGMALTALISTGALTLTQTMLLRKRMGDSVKPFLSTVSWAAVGVVAMMMIYGSADISPTTITESSETSFAQTDNPGVDITHHPKSHIGQ